VADHDAETGLRTSVRRRRGRGKFGILRPMKSRCVTLGLLFAFISLFSLAAPVGAWPGSAYPHAIAQTPLPKLTARAALVQENTANKMLYGREQETQIAPASTIKLLTAITALTLGQVDEKIQADKADLVGGSTMGLKPGDTVTLGNLLKGMLIPSGNDAATVIAHAEGAKLPDAATVGPINAFVARMNAVGVERGLTATTAVNPSGLDADGMVSTAHDLARLADLVLADPVLAPIVRTQQVTIPSAFGTYPVTNTNELLGTPGVIGVKTGTTDEAGQNLVVAVAENNHRLLIVVLGSTDRYADARALLAYVRAAWSWVSLGDPKGLPGLSRALDAWGVTTHESKMVVLDSRLAPLIRYTLLLSPASVTAATSTTPTASPGPPGARGVIIFSIGDGELARMDVYVANAPAPSTPPA
jgi:serine-type D-Ala-D-Ala carboxypeptidase (penicillin-binding protein 5/6)